MLHGAVVYDMNGREADEADLVLGALGDVGQYIFCSSAGVYLKSSQMPHFEVDAVDPKSRHKACCCLLHDPGRNGSTLAAGDTFAEHLSHIQSVAWCSLTSWVLGTGKAEYRSSFGGEERQLDFHSTGIHIW